jgi:hypothetical protein
VNVVTRGTVKPSKLKEFLSQKYGDVSRVDEVRRDKEGTHYYVSFKDRYFVYRMLYQKTHYGRVIDIIPGMDDPIFISQPMPPKIVWMQLALRMYHFPDLRDEDVLDYFDEFLNLRGCNPGIVAVTRKNNLTPFYELYFTNLWHTYDVFHRLNQWKKNNDEFIFYCRVNKDQSIEGVNFYKAVKWHLM